MSSQRPKVEERVQLCLKFLGPSATIIRNANLPLKNESSSLKVTYRNQV
jgi:hypothetical protein